MFYKANSLENNLKRTVWAEHTVYTSTCIWPYESMGIKFHKTNSNKWPSVLYLCESGCAHKLMHSCHYCFIDRQKFVIWVSLSMLLVWITHYPLRLTHWHCQCSCHAEDDSLEQNQKKSRRNLHTWNHDLCSQAKWMYQQRSIQFCARQRVLAWRRCSEQTKTKSRQANCIVVSRIFIEKFTWK